MNKNETLEQFQWVDTHCHLQLTKDKIEDLYLENIEYLIIPGIDIQSSLNARDISRSLNKQSYWSAGLHPHEADEFENLKVSNSNQNKDNISFVEKITLKNIYYSYPNS